MKDISRLSIIVIVVVFVGVVHPAVAFERMSASQFTTMAKGIRSMTNRNAAMDTSNNMGRMRFQGMAGMKTMSSSMNTMPTLSTMMKPMTGTSMNGAGPMRSDGMNDSDMDRLRRMGRLRSLRVDGMEDMQKTVVMRSSEASSMNAMGNTGKAMHRTDTMKRRMNEDMDRMNAMKKQDEEMERMRRMKSSMGPSMESSGEQSGAADQSTKGGERMQ